ncbi:hypothetical protein BJY01DRAFT_202451 [Aspergillus pseudoustus]|uniref:Uncharacterized protein n=1 Tax=Aspergillus pseudoustus TaxID=1810923 RepID=A0ABR4KY74_9EURO
MDGQDMRRPLRSRILAILRMIGEHMNVADLHKHVIILVRVYAIDLPLVLEALALTDILLAFVLGIARLVRRSLTRAHSARAFPWPEPSHADVCSRPVDRPGSRKYAVLTKVVGSGGRPLLQYHRAAHLVCPYGTDGCGFKNLSSL